MVEIRIRTDSRDRLSSFFASGHAGWADHGSDVVCAAISTALQSAWLGLTEVASVPVVGEKHDGALRLTWPEHVRDDPAVRAIVMTAARTVEAIAAQYPGSARIVHESDE
ncbi:MAG: ribosomal-processing cysteine protease Prp [Candidatus Eremiobacteraeota bacterium]|nr:ribosomal-processing cysteine protease Prp [Candidatus Eremiobacteraeota bacterium]